MENPQNLDPQIATDTNSITVIQNTFTGLMVENENGELSYGVTKEYAVSDDGLRYVFYLRDDYKWYTNDGSSMDVTAYDFVFAFQRLFNPDMYSPYGEKFACIKNASKILNGDEDVSYTDIGVYASDKYTVTFLLDYPDSDFLRLLAQSYAMPCNESFFNSTHSMYGLYDTTTISNGAFYIKQWFYDKYGSDNFLTLRKNPVNPNTDDYSPYAVQFTIDEDTELSEVQHDFYKDETDLYYSSTLDESSIDKDDVVLRYDIATVGAIFNTDDAQFKDFNLRSAFAQSIDRESALNKASTDIDVAYGIVPTACKFNGSSYRDLVPDTDLIDTSSEDNSLSSFKSATETVGEVSTVRIILENGTVDSSYIKSITDGWAEKFSVTVLIDSLTTEEFQKAIDNGDYQIAVYTLTSQDDRPYSFLSTFLSTNEFFNYSNLEVDTILKYSQQSLSTQELLNEYSQVEKSILNENVFVPLYYKKNYLICSSGTDNVDYDPFSHTINFSYALNYNQED